jgi:hypothetical protein
MKRTTLWVSTLACFAWAAGCAGTLTQDEQQRLFDEWPGGTGGTPTGAGGGTPVDTCVVGMTGAMHTCQSTIGCHGGPMVAAGLNLDDVNLTQNFKAKYKDVSNTGDPTGVAPPCTAGMAKLIDSSNAMNSLIYTKLQAMGESNTPPCGSKMPFVGSISSQEKACILSWINSVINAP